MSFSLEIEESSKDKFLYYIGKEYINQPKKNKEKIKNFILKIYSKRSDEDVNLINENVDNNYIIYPASNKYNWEFENKNFEIYFSEEGTPKMSGGFSPSIMYIYKRIILYSDDIELLNNFSNYITNYKNLFDVNDNNIKIYYNFKTYWELFNVIQPQDINDIYLNKDIKDNLIEYIDNFLDMKEKYIKFGRIHKINILLYGVPGSGKTCLCKAIAKKYNIPIYILNFSKSLTDEIFIQLISSIPKKSIILLEDLDSFFEKRNSLDINISFSCLINILDGTMSKGNGNIIFITANNPSNMDSALLRPGRIDKILKFNYPEMNTIKEAFDNLVNKNKLKDFDNFYQKIKKMELNMSSIIDYLFRNPDTFNDNIEELENQYKQLNEINLNNNNLYL